ncbi:MAG: Hint domain-containing protein [Alphaproteobacteria bacterium]|nr:Hint domain-containing protein [Alphaproteobacteria bacterium]
MLKDSTSNPNTWFDLTKNSIVSCFVSGTMIALPEGDRLVEELRPGDLILTADGQALPLRWLGRSTISRFFADPLRILPVRIKAGALGENMPARDLLLSPGHGIRIGDLLVHASALVNGASVVRDEDAPLVFTYYHIELDTHTLVLAEGVPAESFLDQVEAVDFDNWEERKAPAAEEEMPYPRVKSPRQLPRALRSALVGRANALFRPLARAA